MSLSYFTNDQKTLWVALFLAFSGCASNSKVRAQQEDIDGLKKQFGELKAQLGTLGTRVDAVEGKMSTLAERPAPPVAPPSSLRASGVGPHPSEGIGASPDKIPAAGDPEPGFVNDEAVQEFRSAMITFEAGRYADSSVAFASFLERYPDHPFAGAAQFYVGKSYLRQNQYTQAYDEFQRVLTSYDRSSHIAETLRDLAETEDKLHKSQDAARHRQLLSSLFPQSPAYATAAVRPRNAAEPRENPVAQKQLEEIAGEPAPSRRRVEPVRPAVPKGAQLDEPPPPTAPVEKLPVPAKPAAPRPGDVYPATEDKS